MNPRVRMRVGQPTELSWSLLERLLCQVSQHEEPWIGARGERTILLGTITTAGARLPLHGAVLQLDHQRLFNMRPQGHTCRFRQTGHRASTPGTRGHCLIAWHRHLPSSMKCLGEMVHDKP